MAISTVIILMTINGHAVCEIMGKPHKGNTFLAGALLAGLGVLGPFVWKDASFWLAIPTSILGFTLIPVAYLAFFFLLMNNIQVLGRERPKGTARMIWNIFMLLSLGIMGTAAIYVAWNKSWGLPFGKFALVTFGILMLIGHFTLRNRKISDKIAGLEMQIKRLNDKVTK